MFGIEKKSPSAEEAKHRVEEMKERDERRKAMLDAQRAADPDGLTKRERVIEDAFAERGSVEVFESTTGDTFTYRAAFDGRILEGTEPDRSRYLSAEHAREWGRKRVVEFIDDRLRELARLGAETGRFEKL